MSAYRRLSVVSGLKYFPRSFVYKVETMDRALKLQGTLVEQDRRIGDAVRRDWVGLRNCIRRRVTDDGDVLSDGQGLRVRSVAKAKTAPCGVRFLTPRKG